MWKAGGGDLARQPSNWLASAEAKHFAAFLAEIQTPGNSGSLVETKEGRGGGTWAYWQLGLAYAKYLSLPFHAWGNQVIGDRMEGKIGRPEGVRPDLTPAAARITDRRSARLRARGRGLCDQLGCGELIWEAP